MAHRVDKARKLLPLSRRPRRGRRGWHLHPRDGRGLLRRLDDACCVHGTWPLPSQRRGSPPPGSSTWTDGRPLVSLDSWSRREAVLIPDKVCGGQLSWKTSIEPVLVAALPGDTWCAARWNPATRRLEPRPAAGGAACTAAACDLQRYTLGFQPTIDVLLTDQVGTVLLLLADVTIAQIGPEIASGACVRLGSAGACPSPPRSPPPATCSLTRAPA